MADRIEQDDCEPPNDTGPPVIFDWYFMPGRGVEMSRRKMRRARLYASHPVEPSAPLCLSAILNRIGLNLPRAAWGLIFENDVPHPLAGPRTTHTVAWRLEWRYPDQGAPWEWLFSGLFGFPLCARLARLVYRWASKHRQRFVGLLVRICLNELGQKFRERSYCLSTLLLLSLLIVARPDADRPDGDDVEAIAHHLPRAPGLDSFGLYVPRC